MRDIIRRWCPRSRRSTLLSTVEAAKLALAAFEPSALGRRYPAIIRTRRCGWVEFAPFLWFPPELRRVVSGTSLIESINSFLITR